MLRVLPQLGGCFLLLIRTAECAGTFEEHSSKVWCVDIVGDRMVSGGADSKICPLSGMMGTQRGVGTWNKLYQSC